MFAATSVRRYSSSGRIEPTTLLVLILAATLSNAANPCPRSWQVDSREEKPNQNSIGDPIFWLRSDGTKNGYQAGQTYTLTVENFSGNAAITDLLATTETDKPGCGNGRFSVQPDGYLYQPDRCPSVVSFGSKTSVQRVHLRWTPPQCACANIRITVKSTRGFYYSGNPPNNGLHRTICPQDMVARKPTVSHRRSFEDEIAKLEEESLSQLCYQVKQQQQQRKKYFSEYFLQSRKLRDLQESDPRWDILQLALEQRRTDVSFCCRKRDLLAREECFEDIRRTRIDQTCGDGYPAVPYAKHRETWMKSKEETCCYELAESRYECFAKNSVKRNSDSPETLVFYDENNPMLDLEYYQTKPAARHAKPLDMVDRQREISHLTFGNGGPRQKMLNRGDDIMFVPGGQSSNVQIPEKSADGYTGGKNIENLKDDRHVDPMVLKRLKESRDASYCCTEGLRVGHRLPKYGSTLTLRKFCNVVRNQYQDASLHREQSGCSKAFLNCCIESARSEIETKTTTVKPKEQNWGKRRRGRRGKVIRPRKTTRRHPRLRGIAMYKILDALESGGHRDTEDSDTTGDADRAVIGAGFGDHSRRPKNRYRSIDGPTPRRSKGTKTRSKLRMRLRDSYEEYSDDDDGDDDNDAKRVSRGINGKREAIHHYYDDMEEYEVDDEDGDNENDHDDDGNANEDDYDDGDDDDAGDEDSDGNDGDGRRNGEKSREERERRGEEGGRKWRRKERLNKEKEGERKNWEKRRGRGNKNSMKNNGNILEKKQKRMKGRQPNMHRHHGN